MLRSPLRPGAKATEKGLVAVAAPKPMERGAIRSARQSRSRRGWSIPQLEKMFRTRAHADDLIGIFAFRHFILRMSGKPRIPGQG